jgi:hypothetical protein
MPAYTEDHLVEQPTIQLMQHELGWDVVNCYDDPSSLKLRRTGWNSGVSNQGRDGKPSSPRLRRPRREGVLVSRLRPALQRLNPDLPVEAIEGAVEEMEILNDEFWILNGRGGRSIAHRLNRLHLALSLAEVSREIDKHRRPSSEVLFALEPDRLCNRLVINEFLFELKTSTRRRNRRSKLAIPLEIFHNPAATHEDA